MVKVSRDAGMVLAVLGFVMLGGSVALGLYVIVMAGAIGLLWPWSLVYTTVRRARPVLVGPWRYEFTDDGLRVTTPLGLCDMPGRACRATPIAGTSGSCGRRSRGSASSW